MSMQPTADKVDKYHLILFEIEENRAGEASTGPVLN
jgi:hypothetical protein